MIRQLIGECKRWYHRISCGCFNNELLPSIHAFADDEIPTDLEFIEFEHNTPLKGFYMLELVCTDAYDNQALVLYWEKCNEQLSHGHSVKFTLGRRKVFKRIVYLDIHSNVLAISGLSDLSKNSISLKLSKVTKKYATKKIITKLKANNMESSIYPHSSFHELYEAYNALFDPTDNPVNYSLWLERNESWCSVIPAGQQKIKFSIILPVYKANLEYLKIAIDSTLNQTYQNLELCIADDFSDSEEIKALLTEYENRDSRVKVLLREQNGNISQASNSAVSMATGRYLVLLDHDDELSLHALNEVACKLAEKPYKVIYSDEDKINENNIRFAPHFKSDFNNELILSHNYISHLGVYERDLVERVGGFRTGYEGAQDYDLLLRCLAQIDVTDVAHIPKILYHWRAINGSTALNSGEKSYTHQVGLKAVSDYVAKKDLSWSVVDGELVNTYKIKRVIKSNPLVSIIIPTKDQLGLLKACIDSILNKTDYTHYEIVVVDNGSVERKTLNYLKNNVSNNQIRVLSYPHKFNYSAINNFAVSQCTDSDYVLLLNNDIEVINPEWLTEMLSIAQQDDVGCVGAKLYYSNGRVQHGGVILGIGGVAGHSHKYFRCNDHGYFSRLKVVQDLSAVTAACLLVKRSIYMSVDGLNEQDLTIAFNDVDFCMKVKALGYRNVWTPYAKLYHHESISRGNEDKPEKIQRFNSEVEYMKSSWGDLLQDDPYYNKNLTLQHEDFSLR